MNGESLNSIIDSVLSQCDNDENEDFDDASSNVEVEETEKPELDLDSEDAGEDVDDLFD